jgi:hypothetical protein
VVTSRTEVTDVATRRPVQTWIARTWTRSGLMVVVIAGPRTRAGVATGPVRPVPLLSREQVARLAADVARLGY